MGVFPVLYQAAIDKLDNFVREICSKYESGKCIIEVSILFNNEQLRRHRVVNGFYEKFRLFFYARRIYVDTFRIYIPADKFGDNYFTFKGIYSRVFGINLRHLGGTFSSILWILIILLFSSILQIMQ